MLWLIIISSYAISIGLFWVIVAGGVKTNAKKRLNRAAELTIEHNFDLARQQVLSAVRLNSAFREDPDVKALYEIIVAKNASEQAMDQVREIREAFKLLRKAKVEVIFGSPVFKGVTMIILIYYYAFRLFEIIHPH